MTTCGSCGKDIKLEDAHWLRITDPDGGKIEECTICSGCATKLSRAIKYHD